MVDGDDIVHGGSAGLQEAVVRSSPSASGPDYVPPEPEAVFAVEWAAFALFGFALGSTGGVAVSFAAAGAAAASVEAGAAVSVASFFSGAGVTYSSTTRIVCG